MSQRFSLDYDLSRWDSHLGDYQGEAGVVLKWYRWNDDSEVDDIYDVGANRSWSPAVLVPALFVMPVEGPHGAGSRGLEPADSVAWAVSGAVFRERLYWDEELDQGAGHKIFLKDRVSYRGLVYTVDFIEPAGDLNDQDMVITGGGKKIIEDMITLDQQEVFEG